ncbi:MAG TPA: CpcT/CpeT family chromophore lyase [Steroidobacteraceae bacterium]|nr:CpcT/CpeT family chromophore lyase [Steroidobacteraceae bacterium]
MGEVPAAAGVLARSLRLALLACAALAVGCASQQAKHERDADLEQINEWLPGHYDNEAQIAADRRAGRVPHEALTLSVSQVHAGEIGVQMFYLQEMRRGSREIKLQRLLSMGIANDQIVATLWSFTDPPRWREGDTTPELFDGLQPPDVQAMRGCNLIFKKEGSRFTAADKPGRCNPDVSSTGVPESLEMRVELSPDELAISMREVDSQGHALNGASGDPYIRFRRSRSSGS